MNDFHDPELEKLFGRNSGPTPDVDVAYQRVQGRVRQVKRRRAVVVSGAACSLLFAAAVFAGARGDGGNSVQPGGTGVDGSPLTVPDSSDSSTPTPTSGSDGTTPESTTLGTGTITTVASGGTVVTSPDVSTASTAPGATSGATPTTSAAVPSSSPSTSVPTSTTPVTNPPAAVTQTFSGVGGSITVRLQNGSLTLVSYNAASGFTADVNKSSGSRVEVRFESATQRTDIRVDIVGNAMSAQIDES